MMYLLVSQHVSGIIMPIIRRTAQRWCIYWCLNMFRASSCPSLGGQYKDDVFIGVSTCFGHHHAHHQENSTKMIYLLVSQHVSGIIMPIIRRTVQRWCIYWRLNMFRASSCPSSGEEYKHDVFFGVSTCFGHHHAHHQENSTNMMYLLVSQRVSGIIMPIIRTIVQRWCIYWCLNMSRAPPCGSSGEPYKDDVLMGVS
jgi:large-conductance mechanosensitive channel